MRTATPSSKPEQTTPTPPPAAKPPRAPSLLQALANELAAGPPSEGAAALAADRHADALAADSRLHDAGEKAPKRQAPPKFDAAARRAFLLDMLPRVRAAVADWREAWRAEFARLARHATRNELSSDEAVLYRRLRDEQRIAMDLGGWTGPAEVELASLVPGEFARGRNALRAALATAEGAAGAMEFVGDAATVSQWLADARQALADMERLAASADWATLEREVPRD